MVSLVNLPQKVNQESSGSSTFTTQPMFFITLAVNLKTYVISLDAEKLLMNFSIHLWGTGFSKLGLPVEGNIITLQTVIN